MVTTPAVTELVGCGVDNETVGAGVTVGAHDAPGASQATRAKPPVL